MACGLPVIAVDALGIPEIIKDKINGFLVKPDNTKEMARKITQLLSDEKLLEKFSAASRKMSLDYSQENVAKSLENTYKELIVQTNENLSLSRIL
jgi:glycosyltransferase involved in cell wall biosynthesis